MEKPKCSLCRHFYITWDQKTPNGCRRFGIQCKDLPSSIVAQAGLGECNGFEAKKRPEKKDVLDLNRKDLW
ncbi:MAG: hypothetical protein ACLGHN_00515 [Bacteriovoracia bacterium]